MSPRVLLFYVSLCFSQILFAVTDQQAKICAANLVKLTSESPGEPTAVDLRFLQRMHELNGLSPDSPEYAKLSKTFLSTEYHNMGPEMKTLVDSIRKEGKIPLFVAVDGDYAPPESQSSSSKEKEDELILKLKAQGLPWSEIARQLGSRFRRPTISTSLSLSAALSVPVHRVREGQHGPLSVAVLVWDGTNGASFGDPLEIRIDPLAAPARNVFRVEQGAFGGKKAGSRDVYWLDILNGIGKLKPH